ITVRLLNDSTITAEYAGTVQFSEDFVLFNVLYIADFCFNLHYKKCVVYRRNITKGFLAVDINHIPKAFTRQYKHSLNLGFPYSILPKSLRKQDFPFLSSLSPLPSPPPLSYFVPQRTSIS
ncbi:hypothetical protein V8G54_019525, partial [Vigna mungo]